MMGRRGDGAANDMVRVIDRYGQELLISKQDWRDDVLPASLEAAKGDPDKLYSLLVSALGDGLASDIVVHAQHLQRTDTIPSRGTVVLAIVYMELGRLDDAQSVLERYISGHGEDGTVLTNLGKVHSRRGDDARAEALLVRALERDPNQDDGLAWYAAIQRERHGHQGAIEAFRRVAALPGSWRARIWLAKEAVKTRNLEAALTLYEEALSRAGSPAPYDLLMEMSGELGQSGYLAEVIRLVGPRFDVSRHGLEVGNNLIKAYHDLGRHAEAREILQQLYAQKRPDWLPTLRYWDGELAEATVAERAEGAPEQVSLSLLVIEGPLWARRGSPFGGMIPLKDAGAKRIAIFGSTVVRAEAPARPQPQLADGPGRLSRALPVLLAERIHIGTNATGLALIPWVEGQGFAVFGHPYDDRGLFEVAAKGGEKVDFVFGLTVDTTRPRWRLRLRLLGAPDGRRIDETEIEATPDGPGPSASLLAEDALDMLARSGVEAVALPDWYDPPTGPDSSDYLLRLEQQLTVATERLPGAGLFGEREMLDGILQLSARRPEERVVRMVLAETLRQMKEARPELMSEYEERVGLLQRSHPVPGHAGALIDEAIQGLLGR